jgi:hypothetical protein
LVVVASAACGVPEIAPLLAFRVAHAGKVPELTLHL